MKKIVFATNNAHKLRELREIAGDKFEILSLKDINCFLDTSSSSALMEEGMFERLIKAYGADRLLFGTDFPMWDSKEELERFMSISLSETDREKILYSNAVSLLKI